MLHCFFFLDPGSSAVILRHGMTEITLVRNYPMTGDPTKMTYDFGAFSMNKSAASKPVTIFILVYSLDSLL